MEDDDLSPDEVRSPQEIARRALVLFGVWGLTVGGQRCEILGWLDDYNLREALSPSELRFIDNQYPSSKQEIDFSWHSERLIVLLWALNWSRICPAQTSSAIQASSSICFHLLWNSRWSSSFRAPRRATTMSFGKKPSGRLICTGKRETHG